ncbi:MAG: hypothetical protein ABMA13_08190 [Chthoniobacteraceae bacterium]
MNTRNLARKPSAFSLVEVALAIAVVSFAVIGILSLLSSGLGNYRQVMDTTVCAQIAQRVINDAGQADFNVLTDATNKNTIKETADAAKESRVFSFRAPSSDKPSFRYFDDQGNEIIAKEKDGKLKPEQRTQAVYWVNVRIIPRAFLPRADGKATELAQLTVEIACNANVIDLSDTKAFFVTEKKDPRYNLFKPPGQDKEKNIPAGIRVLTYSAYVGRNG